MPSTTITLTDRDRKAIRLTLSGLAADTLTDLIALVEAGDVKALRDKRDRLNGIIAILDALDGDGAVKFSGTALDELRNARTHWRKEAELATAHRVLFEALMAKVEERA